jgi:hypothetical protein
MKLQCTKKLLDQLKVMPVEMETENEVYSWQANVVTVDRRKMLVLVHDSTQYKIAFYGLKAKDWKNLNAVIREGIAKVWAAEGIKASVIEKYLAQMGELVLTKTRDRKMIARLNYAVRNLEWYFHRYREDGLVQITASTQVNKRIVGDWRKDHIWPKKALVAFLTEFAGAAVVETAAVIMKIQLDFENLSVWRRVQVPLYLTFKDFHRVIQTVFGWKSYHLHSYYLFGDLAKKDDSLENHPGYHPRGMLATLCLVESEEDLEYGDPYVRMELESGRQLRDWMTDQMIYVYDFGDNWIHLIDVEKIVYDPEKPGVICLEGEGDAPPEDVGGEYGFEDFLEAMADESHPNHARYKEWSQSQYYQKFDRAHVNCVL